MKLSGCEVKLLLRALVISTVVDRYVNAVVHSVHFSTNNTIEQKREKRRIDHSISNEIKYFIYQLYNMLVDKVLLRLSTKCHNLFGL
ncbi:hypothetical protein AKO1_008052 [Acrasis kona]|uniref:Secreted protein n=1 Tax=Acrasis kona TaxID=1008807 RepID=A0AAW2YPU8_9EUKA